MKNNVHLHHLLRFYVEPLLLGVISFLFRRSIGGFALEDPTRPTWFLVGQVQQVRASIIFELRLPNSAGSLELFGLGGTILHMLPSENIRLAAYHFSRQLKMRSSKNGVSDFVILFSITSAHPLEVMQF